MISDRTRQLPKHADVTCAYTLVIESTREYKFPQANLEYRLYLEVF